jgi:hypothetical protein
MRHGGSSTREETIITESSSVHHRSIPVPEIFGDCPNPALPVAHGTGDCRQSTSNRAAPVYPENPTLRPVPDGMCHVPLQLCLQPDAVIALLHHPNSIGELDTDWIPGLDTGMKKAPF